jgi:hypothetical protein
VRRRPDRDRTVKVGTNPSGSFRPSGRELRPPGYGGCDVAAPKSIKTEVLHPSIGSHDAHSMSHGRRSLDPRDLRDAQAGDEGPREGNTSMAPCRQSPPLSHLVAQDQPEDDECDDNRSGKRLSAASARLHFPIVAPSLAAVDCENPPSLTRSFRSLLHGQVGSRLIQAGQVIAVAPVRRGSIHSSLMTSMAPSSVG